MQKAGLMSKIKTLKSPTSVWLIALALTTMCLSGCGTGGTNTKLQVTPDFLGKIIDERDDVIACCPAHNEVLKDWIAQNAP